MLPTVTNLPNPWLWRWKPQGFQSFGGATASALVDDMKGAATFSFVDVTNASVNPAYVDGVSIHIVDPAHLNLQFEFGGSSAKRATETILLQRIKPAAT